MSSFYDPPPADKAVSSTHAPFSAPDPGDEGDASDAMIGSAETMIAQALKNLSLEDREQVYMEQHGVSDPMEFDDNPEFVTRKLIELEKNLQTLTASIDVPTEAYTLARKQNRSYVQDITFRLRFLYAELFDTQKAASRIIRYFNYKQHLFGDDRLTIHVGLGDLTPEEVLYMKEGYVQVLPSRDTAGRPVVVIFPHQAKTNGCECFGRILSTLIFSGSHAIEKKGIVIIMYHTGSFNQYGKGNMRGTYIGARAISDLSVRFAAFHHCCNDAQFELHVNQFMRLSGTVTQAKHKIHYGNHSECMHSLMTYGIPHELVPVAADGTIKRKNHMEWLRSRELLEEALGSGSSAKTFELPSNDDILLGRGRRIQEHRGNRTLQQLVDDLLPRYDKLTSKKEKKTFTAEIVRNIKSRKGHFLSQDSGVWAEVTDEVARAKVSHLFRNRRIQARVKPVVARKTGERSAFGLVSDPRDMLGSDKRVRLG